MSVDVMVDLETLGTKPNAIILSIGACVVNWKETEPNPKFDFYRVVNVDSCREAGLTECTSTRLWWEKQDENARKVFTDPNVPLMHALSDFYNHLRSFNLNQVRVWGNGSDFDNVILNSAYNAVGLNAPWRFYNSRCFRTIRKVFGHTVVEPPREGTYHNALDDAKHQARILAMIGQKTPMALMS